MHGSGEIMLAFSTANQVPRETRKMVYRMKILLDQRLDPLYEAVIEATEEAILNALCMARDMDGVNGNVCPALPLAEVKEIVARWQAEKARQLAVGPAPARRAPPGAAADTRLRAATPGARPSAARGAEGMPAPARPAEPGPPAGGPGAGAGPAAGGDRDE
jgi:D-aminopeptidase